MAAQDHARLINQHGRREAKPLHAGDDLGQLLVVEAPRVVRPRFEVVGRALMARGVGWAGLGIGVFIKAPAIGEESDVQEDRAQTQDAEPAAASRIRLRSRTLPDKIRIQKLPSKCFLARVGTSESAVVSSRAVPDARRSTFEASWLRLHLAPGVRNR